MRRYPWRYGASLGAMGSLLRKLDLLVEASEEDNGCRLRLHKGAIYATHLLKDDLEEITSYLEDLSEVEDPPLTAKCWMKEIGRLVETNKKLNRRKRVAAMISDFRIYAQEAIERHQRYELHCCTSRRRFEPAGGLPITYEEDADIIIDGRMSKFMESLANDRDQQLRVVSVVGSEGIGKTTFVEVLYSKLKGQFDCRAFIRLPRKPDIKTMLRDILTQVQRQQPDDHCEDTDLIGKIREHIQHKRYLIVIDDLWSASIWDILSHAFPGGRTCSRIITTTQSGDVALACCCYHSECVFEMRPLDDDLSRKLFFSRIFCSERDFPPKMKEVSDKIVKLCGGSPLATTITARRLASHPVMSLEQWTYIYDSLSFNLGTSSTSEGLLKLIVNFSYNNLTHHLKTCLLYLNMYPEGCTVRKDDLVKQWVAEGFIDATEGREVEIAESYFHELIARRFLQPAGIKYGSEVVSCSVHYVVRDLIAQKSLEENFIVVLDCYRRNVALSEKVHRLSLHFPQAKYARTNLRSSQVRSLTYFGVSKCMPSIREFKLLRVLNLGLSTHDDGDDTTDLTGISELLQLRYLKVVSDVCIELPKHMRGLQYLETLDIGPKIRHVPWDIFHLPCLLHLHLPFQTNLMDWVSVIPASMWSLGTLINLQHLYLTFCIPVPYHLQRNMEALGSLLGGHGNLKTLALILGSAHKNVVVQGPSEVSVSWDDFAPPHLERFEWLPHIFTFFRVPKWMGKLGKLCILKISVRELLGDDANILGELPTLTALTLYAQIAPVKRIVFDKAGFSALKYFKLISSTVPWLKFEGDAMPNLKRLKLAFSAHGVDQHGTTPISIDHLAGLEEISVKVGDASSDAETALTAVVSNHPRNPRVRAQLVDWRFYGDGVWYMLSRQNGHPTVDDEDLRDDDYESKDYARHGGGKRRRKENYTNTVKSPDASASPSIIGERSVVDSVPDGGKRCQMETCTQSAKGHSGFCVIHSGAQGRTESENLPGVPLNSQALQPPKQPGTPGRSRGRPDLTLSLPQRGLTYHAVAPPLQLPPSSTSSSRSQSQSGPASLGGLTSPTSAGFAPPSHPPPLGELERVRRIGGGASGTVWMVRHRPTGQAYALRVINVNNDGDAVRRQITRQIAILRTAEHPAVVRCYGMYEQAGGLQVLLEYMDGGSLEGRHIADEPFLAHLARQVLSGIAYLHRRHIVHRDIKPSKVLIDSSRGVKIADFGVGRILNRTTDPGNSSSGTIAYMSPERINTDLNDGAYDGYAGDIWSFGLCILEFYLGRFPLGKNLDKPGALMSAICYSDSPQAPHSASPDFKNFISLCLQKNPANRPSAMRLLQHPFVAQPQPQSQPYVLPAHAFEADTNPPSLERTEPVDLGTSTGTEHTSDCADTEILWWPVKQTYVSKNYTDRPAVQDTR